MAINLTPKRIMKKMNDCIYGMYDNLNKFVNRPGTDFTRPHFNSCYGKPPSSSPSDPESSCGSSGFSVSLPTAHPSL